MRVSVVGCGGVSKSHLRALSEMESVTISSVVDIVREKADSAALKYGCKAYYDYETMLSEDKPDCVHICTPHYLHVPMSVKALTQGIHVLCEKPCAISAEGLSQLKMAQLLSDAKFGVCFQNRYNESAILVKSLVDKGAYGNVEAVRSTVHWFRDEAYYSDDWHGTIEKEGGGVAVNQAIHTQDLMRYVSGKKTKCVTGHVFTDHLKDIIEVEDTVHAIFEYEDGTLGLYSATTAFSKNLPVIIDVVCEKATLRLEGDNAYLITDSGIEQLHLADNEGFVGKNYWGKGHSSLISDFYDCIKEDRKFPIDAIEGGKAVEEFLAIFESSAKGDKVYLKKE
ncbi:MAG: Gfo/Idh/MocA family oxidoreductase [Acutalibacteraceae bacterium]|nr:Gfo/Idh/MocA family oxidoreductase [Acutalibacteraceae bacterium]